MSGEMTKFTKRSFLKLFGILIIISGMALGCIMPVNAQEGKSQKAVNPYKVLCILSYNYAYNIVEDEINGIEDGLSDPQYEIDYEITYESMDAKNFYRADDVEEFEEYLTYKLSQRKDYDLIVATDDTALRFVINNRSKLFGEIPVVFMGVYNISDANTAVALENIAGVAEVPDFESNYELMKKFFPERTKITAIVDGTNTGQGQFVQFMEFIQKHPDQEYSILNTSRYSRKGIRDYLKALGDDDIILFLDFLEDGDGNIYALDTAGKFISQYAPNVPVFRVASADMENGVLGGVSYSYYEAAKLAGSMGARILSGESASDIGLMMDTVTNTYFEQSMMDQYGIRYGSVPVDAVILNERFTLHSWYRGNMIIANLVILVAILLVIIIILLAISNNRREKMVNKDNLTGIANRLYINKQIRNLSSNKERYGVVMVDLDYFKSINDNLGHLIGDQVLLGLAKRLESAAGQNDSVVARIGGDEFLILVKNGDTDRCKKLCEDVLNVMKEPIVTEKGEVTITLSMGGAIFPDDADSSTKLMSLADKALYKAKKDGRNGFRMYSEISIT